MGKAPGQVCECDDTKHNRYTRSNVMVKCPNRATKLCQVCGMKVCSNCARAHHPHSRLVPLPKG